jgi:hypothetical protein
MTRKLDAAQEGASPVLSLRLSPALAAALAAEAHRRSTAAGGVPVSPAAVARVLLERALLADPSSSTPDPAPVVAPSSSTPPAAAPQEAAQRPRRSSTPRSTTPRSEAAAAPPAPAPVVADDDEAAAIARHDARNEEQREMNRIEALRADLAALIERGGWSGRRIGAAIDVSGRTVSQFVNGSTEGWPRWGEAARAWLDALPAAAPSPDLQRPLFTTGSPNDDGT